MFILDVSNFVQNSGTVTHQKNTAMSSMIDSLDNSMRLLVGDAPGIGVPNGNPPSNTPQPTYDPYQMQQQIDDLKKQIDDLKYQNQQLANQNQQLMNPPEPQMSPAMAQFLKNKQDMEFANWYHQNFWPSLCTLMTQAMGTTAPVSYIANNQFFQMSVEAVAAYTGRDLDVNMYRQGAIYLANLAYQYTLSPNTLPDFEHRIAPFNLNHDGYNPVNNYGMPILDYYGKPVTFNKIDASDLAWAIMSAPKFDPKKHNYVYTIPGIPIRYNY